VRARVPAAGRSWETTFVAPLPFRERVFGLRPFDLVLRTRLAAGVVTVKCPFPFMIRFLSSFQAQAIGGKAGFASLAARVYLLCFQVVKPSLRNLNRQEKRGSLLRFPRRFWILVI
jgi:hypothetical protein